MLLLVLSSLLLVVGTPAHGQCAITAVTIEINTTESVELRDADNLRLVINGNTTGAQATSVIWTRDSNPISTEQLDDYFIGGGEEIRGGDPCVARIYRVALLIRRRLPGVYQYTVTNDDTPEPISSRAFIIEDSSPPSNLTLRQVSGRRVQASWTAPSNPIRNYRVFVNNPNINGDGREVNSTTYTTRTAFNLGAVVTFYVRAVTTYYWSEVRTSSINILDMLSPIANSSANTTSVTLSLSVPTMSLPASQYTATLTSSACDNTIPIRNGTTTMDSIIIRGLQEGIQYSVRIVATNTDTGLTSAATTTTLTTLEAVPSGFPGMLTVTSLTSTNIYLTWTPITCIEQNGIITSYAIQYGQRSTRDLMITTSSATSHTISGLLPFTYYTFRVAGVNSEGKGPFSSETELIRTNEDRPTEVRDLRGVPNLITIDLSWLEPVPANGIIIQYTITYSVNGSTPTINISSRSRFTVPDLLPGTLVYNITVFASTRIGPGPAVTVPYAIATLTAPSQVQNVIVEVLTSTSVKVSWDKLDVQEITHYIIYYRQIAKRKRQVETTVQVPATANSVVISNLTSSGHYVFEVEARLVIGEAIFVGPRSDRNTVGFITVPTTSESNRRVFNAVVVTAVIVFVATVILYTIIVVLIGVPCYCRKRRQKESMFSSETSGANKRVYETMNRPPETKDVEMKAVDLYEDVFEKEDDLYEEVPHRENVNGN